MKPFKATVVLGMALVSTLSGARSASAQYYGGYYTPYRPTVYRTMPVPPVLPPPVPAAGLSAHPLPPGPAPADGVPAPAVPSIRAPVHSPVPGAAAPAV